MKKQKRDGNHSSPQKKRKKLIQDSEEMKKTDTQLQTPKTQR
jgi:hypothetical protein